MSYLNKYQKYKKKYLNLLNEINQSGGTPNTLILKNFNLFTNYNAEQYLNPIYGYILYKSDFLKNCIISKKTLSYNTPITNLVYGCFNLNGTEIQLKARHFNLKPEDIANFVGYWFVYLNEISQYDDILKEVNDMTKLVKDCIRNKYDAIPPHNRHKVCDSLDEKIKTIKSFIYNNNLDDESTENDLRKTLDKLMTHLNNMNKENTDTRIQKKKEFDSKYSLVYSSETVKNIFDEFIKFFNKDAIDSQMFHVLLAILWVVSNKKDDYKKYYETLNVILPSEYQVIIPDNYERINFTESEIYNNIEVLNEDNVFFKELIKMTQITEITLEDHSYLSINGFPEKYPDCGETAVRNFVKILSYDPVDKIFSLDKLTLLGAIPDVIEYFTVYKTDDIHISGNKFTFKDKEYDARTAWDTLISNLPNIRYKTTKKMPDKSVYEYEIRHGHGVRTDENNLLCVLKEIFKEINEWSDFVRLGVFSSIEVMLNEKFAGTIEFDSYVWKISVTDTGGHSSITKKNEYRLINRNKITKRYKTYFDILTVNKNYKHYNFIDNWMLFVTNYSNDFNLVNYIYDIKSADNDITYEHVKFNFDAKLYSALIQNISKINTVDELRNFKFLYKYVSKSDIKACIQYFDDYSDFKNLEVLELSYADCFSWDDEKRFFNFNSIKNNNKLRKISIFGFEYSEPIGTSMSKLTNLDSLDLDNYNYQLNDSLSNLTNLRYLSIGHYGFPIGDSFNNLTNLQYLSLTNYTNQLNYSLKNLTNLKHLYLNDYEYPLNNSLETLTNLECLELFLYNEPLGDSLNNLVALDTLNLIYYDFPLGKSLNNLTKLQSLSLNRYTHPLKDDLANCTSLTTLYLGTYNLPLLNSLDNLVNLNQISLSSYNKDIPSSFNKLTNLKNLFLESYENYDKYIQELMHMPDVSVIVAPTNYHYD